MAVTCPKCNCSIGLPAGYARGRIRCPKCRASLRVQADESEAASDASSVDGEAAKVPTDAPEGACRKVAVGDVIGGCQMEEMLGAGAMGLVYRATQLSLQRQVAVKVLPTRLASQPKFVERFDRESAALAALNHPNIVSIFDRGLEQGAYYFVMEYVQGRTLHQAMREGDMPQGQIFQVMEQMCSALNYAQRQHIVHRDIKPRNVMLNEQGRVKIADFGLAFLMGEEETEGKRYGTAGYMSPEQRKGAKDVDGRSDLYSTAVVFYEMLVGKKPDAGYVEPSHVRGGLSPALDYVLYRGLQADPSLRYQTPIEMLTDIRMSTQGKGAFLGPCPQCGTHNQAQVKACPNCHADLADLFDGCPNCGIENRLDMGACGSCKYDLRGHRKQLWTQVMQIRKEADALLKQLKFGEVEAEIDRLAQLPGKEFRKVAVSTRTLARRMLSNKGGVVEAARKKAMQLCQQHKYGQARLMLESANGPEADLSKEIAMAKERMDKRLVWSDQGDELWRKEDVAGAFEAFSKAYAIWPDNDALRESCHKAKAAVEAIAQAKAQLAEARTLRQAGDLDRALEICEAVAAAGVESPGLDRVLAEAERARAGIQADRAAKGGDDATSAGKWRDAVREFERAVELLPNGAAPANLQQKLATAKNRVLRQNGIIAACVLAAVAAIVTVVVVF